MLLLFFPFWKKFGEILGQIDPKYVIIWLYMVIGVYLGTYVMICQHPKFVPCHWIRMLAKLEGYIMFILENIDEYWIIIIDPAAPNNIMSGQTLTGTLTGMLNWNEHYDWWSEFRMLHNVLIWMRMMAPLIHWCKKIIRNYQKLP